MVEFKTASGVSVAVNIAPFDDAMALKAAISRAFTASDIKFDIKSLRSNKEIDSNALIKSLMQVDSSPEVIAALFKCLIKCTYDGSKITRDTFETEQAREDYYEIAFACMKVNLNPFLKGLVSKFSTLQNLIKESIQKYK